jgi:hypothetical protein
VTLPLEKQGVATIHHNLSHAVIVKQRLQGAEATYLVEHLADKDITL